MRLMQVVQKLAPGGLEVMALDLAQALPDVEAGLIVSLEGATNDLIAHWPRLQSAGDSLVGLEKPDGISLRTLMRLRRLIKDFQPDIVHTHHIGPLLYGGLAARAVGVKGLVHTEHDVWHLNSGKALLLQRALLRICNPAHIAITVQMAQTLQQKVRRPVTVIHNGVDVAKYVPSASSRDDTAVIIGAAGRLEPVKGMDLLVEGFAQFIGASAGHGRSFQLRIAGDGSQAKELRALIAKLEAGGALQSGQVQLVGRQDDMVQFLHGLDLFVQPSRAEGLPLAPLEAMACNLPTLVTPTQGAQTLAQAGAEVCTDISAQAICEGLAELTRPERAKVDLRPHIEAGFSLQSMSQNYAAVYRSVSG